jgi:hypothetical protein
MDEEHTSRRRLRIAGIAAAAVLAVPGGMVISNAVAADGGGAASSASPSSQAVPVQSEDSAPQERQDRGGTPGDRGDCPGKEGGGEESGSSATGYTQQ